MMWDPSLPWRCCCPGFDRGCHEDHRGPSEPCGLLAEWLVPVLDLPDRQLFCGPCAMTAGSTDLVDEARRAEGVHIRSYGVPKELLDMPPAWWLEREWTEEQGRADE